MSGLCGVVQADGAPVDPALVEAMAEASAYRGPRGVGYSISGAVGLAHLESRSGSRTSRQPLESMNGELVVAADARIDGRDELITLLASKGHLEDPDPNDAALLLASYRSWGEDCPDRIVGDFAFAIWDRPRQRLFLARDPMGVRTLCFAWDGATFRFASDPRQILADRRVSRDLDGYAIADYLTYRFRFEPRTMFAEVRKLLPGHCLALDASGLRVRRYWDPDPTPVIRYPRDEDYVEHFRELLLRSVADRLRDREGDAAVLVSGGLDSSSLLVVAQELHATGRVRARPVGYSLVFDGSLRNCDEREYSDALAEVRGPELHRVVAERDCSLAAVLDHPPALDGPEMQHVDPTHEILRRARERGCSVILTGDGGDELFHAGKLQYVDLARSGRFWKLSPWIAAEREEGRSALRAAAALAVWPLLPLRLRLALDAWRGGKRFARMPSWIRPELAAAAAGDRLRESLDAAENCVSHARKRHREIITGYPVRAAATLDLWGRSAIEYQLEASFPLLDRRLAQFSLTVPLDLCARPGRENTKWLLRQALAGSLPEKIRRRRTKGGGGDAYLEFIFCQRNRDDVRGILDDMHLDRLGLVDEGRLGAVHTSLCDAAGGYQGASELMPALWMELWLRAHDLGGSAVRFPPPSFHPPESSM